MKIELNDSDAKDFLDIVYLGKNISENLEDPKLIKKYDNICGKVLEQYFQQGLKDGIDKNDNKPYPFFTEKYDQKMADAIECYDSRIFYSTIIDQIAKNQLISKVGTEVFETMENEEFEDQFEAMRQKVYQEMNKNGLDNLNIF